MALFVPGVGEKQLDPVQRISGNLVLEDFDRIGLKDTNILEAIGRDEMQELANPGLMDLDPDKIPFWHFCRHLGQRMSISKTDFQCHGATVREQLLQVELILAQVDAIMRPELLDRLALVPGQAAIAFNKAANSTVLDVF